MYINSTLLRVRYAETDQMGVVYYGNYAQYFEVARTESLRELGLTYRHLEDKGIMLPVLSLNIKYIRPAVYDDELRIKTIIDEVPSTRITFHHEIVNAQNELLTTGSVQLVFVDAQTRKPRKAPAEVTEQLIKRINS